MTPFRFFAPFQFDIDLFREANPHLHVRLIVKDGRWAVVCHANPAQRRRSKP